jgi:hypothetical protein
MKRRVLVDGIIEYIGINDFHFHITSFLVLSSDSKQVGKTGRNKEKHLTPTGGAL